MLLCLLNATQTRECIDSYLTREALNQFWLGNYELLCGLPLSCFPKRYLRYKDDPARLAERSNKKYSSLFWQMFFLSQQFILMYSKIFTETMLPSSHFQVNVWGHFIQFHKHLHKFKPSLLWIDKLIFIKYLSHHRTTDHLKQLTFVMYWYLSRCLSSFETMR